MVFYTSVSSEEKENVVCPYCKVPRKIILNGRNDSRLVHDVIRNNYRVDIILFSQRYKCKACEQRFTAPIEGILEGRQMTKRLYEYFQREVFLQPFSNLANSCGFSVDTIEAIINEEAELYEAQRSVYSFGLSDL